MCHHSEVVSLHGFYFELIVSRKDGVSTCYIKVNSRLIIVKNIKAE